MSTATHAPAVKMVPIPPPTYDDSIPPPAKRRASQRKVSHPQANLGSTNPDENAKVLDAPEALRASPDADEKDERINLVEAGMDVEKQVKEEDDSPLSELEDIEAPVKAKKTTSKSKTAKDKKVEIKAEPVKKETPVARPKKEAVNVKEPQFLDPEAEGDEEADEEEIQAALSRPPPVNSDYLPLPWKGRLGYVGIKTTSTLHRLILLGVSMYVPSLLKSTGLQLQDMPHRIYH